MRVNLKRLGGCKPKPPVVRFHASYRVDDETGCWMWLGHPRGSNGYGSIKVGGRAEVAHRYSWALHHGPIPEGLIVCHKCDTPLCVNPEHLFVGTHSDNQQDKMRKGRMGDVGTKTPLRGESNPGSVLSEQDVLKIRNMDEPQRRIARMFGVTQAAISAIKTRKIWRHI